MGKRLIPKDLVETFERDLPLVLKSWDSGLMHIVRQTGRDKSNRFQHVALCNRVINGHTVAHEEELEDAALCKVCAKRGDFRETLKEYREKFDALEEKRRQEQQEKLRISAEKLEREQLFLKAFLQAKFELNEVTGKIVGNTVVITWRDRQFKIELVPKLFWDL